MTQALRWILVLPGAVFAAVLVSFPLHWAVLLTFASSDSFVQLSPDGLGEAERLGLALLGPLAALWAAGRIAPTRKFETAVALGVAMVLLLALGPTLSSGFVFVTVPGIALNLVGIATGAYVVRRDVDRTAAPAPQSS